MKSKLPSEKAQLQAVKLRLQLDAIFEKRNALYMTGDFFPPSDRSHIGLHEKKPTYSKTSGYFISNSAQAPLEGRFSPSDEHQDVPWLIDIASGEMELPTLGLKFTLEEWASM